MFNMECTDSRLVSMILLQLFEQLAAVVQLVAWVCCDWQVDGSCNLLNCHLVLSIAVLPVTKTDTGGIPS